MAEQGFTPAETTVVQLLLEGLSNRAIASRLVVSIRTVESHISNALDKSCLLYTSPSPRDAIPSRMPSSA